MLNVDTCAFVVTCVQHYTRQEHALSLAIIFRRNVNPYDQEADWGYTL